MRWSYLACVPCFPRAAMDSVARSPVYAWRDKCEWEKCQARPWGLSNIGGRTEKCVRGMGGQARTDCAGVPPPLLGCVGSACVPR